MSFYNKETKRYVNLKTAINNGLLLTTSRFRTPANLHIFAVPDKRTKHKFKYVDVTDKRDVNALKRRKNTIQVYPQPERNYVEIDLAELKSEKGWDQKYFVLPLKMLQSRNITGDMYIEFEFRNSVSTHVYGPYIHIEDVQMWWSESGNAFIWNNSSKMLPKTALYIQLSTKFRMTYYKSVQPEALQQAFRDGDTHCILYPILTYFDNLAKHAKSDKTRQNRVSLWNKCLFYMDKYKHGIPESELETVAKGLDVCIVIQDTTFNELYRLNPKSRNQVFRYTNSRINHCEYVTVDLNREATEITQIEAIDILHDCKVKRLHNYYTGTITNPKSIITTTNSYRVGDDNGDILYEFTKQFDRSIAINSIKEPDLVNFLISGANMVINWKNSNRNPINEIDMKKAYTQYKHAPNYIGFPSIISNVRLTAPNHDVKAYPGIYQILIKSMPKQSIRNARYNALQLLKRYGFKNKCNYILTSPWIMELQKHGVDLEIQKGAWAKPFEFDFTPEMIEKKLYSIWTGMQLHKETDERLKMAATPEFAAILASQSDKQNMVYNADTETLMILKPKDYHFIMPHVSAYIISYCQLNVFQEAMRYDPEHIVGHKLDSIMLSCDVKPLNTNLWVNLREEPDFTEIRMAQSQSNAIFRANHNLSDIFKQRTEWLGDYFLAGMGGCGKTQRLLEDKGFRNLVFTSIAWKLIVEKIKEFKIYGRSINQILGIDAKGNKIPSYKDRYGSPGTIVIDEASMISKKTIETIKLLYPYAQIIIMGDYANGRYYQSSIQREGHELYNPPRIYTVNTDYRSIDEETKALKLKVRHIMDDGNINELVKYLATQLPLVYMKDLKAMYDMDYVLTGTHNRIVKFTELLKGEKNHYLVMKHEFEDVGRKCAGEDVYLHGEIVDFEIKDRTKLVHGFTVHSFQGSTIPVDKKCFVDLLELKTVEDIYTAISRVRTMKQLHIVV